MDLTIALSSADPVIYFYGIQDMIRFCLVVSWRAGGHQDVFPAIYACQACKAETGVLGVPCLSAQDFATGHRRIRETLGEGAYKGEAVRMRGGGGSGIGVCSKYLPEIRILKGID